MFYLTVYRWQRLKNPIVWGEVKSNMFFLFNAVISRKKPSKTPAGRNMCQTGLKNQCFSSAWYLEIHIF